MSKVIIPPIRLQQGTEWNEATNFINLNFDNLATAFNGWSADFRGLFGGGTPVNMPAGGLLHSTAGVLVPSLDDELVFVQPTISYYIDYPGTFDFTNPNNDYLYPFGSALSAGALASIFTVVIGSLYLWQMFPDVPETRDPITLPSGDIRYFGPTITSSLRNADSSAHTYISTLSYSSYPRSTNTYR